VNGFPALRLLWADPTSKVPSICLAFYSASLPTSCGSYFGSLKFSKTSLYTCHGLITPPTRHNLAN